MSDRPRPLTVRDLDEFTRRRVADVAERWNEAHRLHQRAERLLWLGTIANGFDDDELSMLDAMGYLCPMDHDLMRSAGRPIPPWPPKVESDDA